MTLSDGGGTVTHASATSLTISVSGLLPGPLSAVVSADGVSTFNTQVATVIPVVTPSTASLAANATSLVINGFGFDPIADDDILSFGGGVDGTVSTATANQLTVTSLTGLKSGSLTASVAVDGQDGRHGGGGGNSETSGDR